MKRPIATFDLDSTLADTRHRHHMINRDGPTDWRAYSMACSGDTIIEPVRALWKSLAISHILCIVSARDYAAHDLTVDWLGRHGLIPHAIFLAHPGEGDGDHGEYKARKIRAVGKLFGHTVDLHVDDWPPVQAPLAAMGVPCLIVTPPRIIDDFNYEGHITHV